MTHMPHAQSTPCRPHCTEPAIPTTVRVVAAGNQGVGSIFSGVHLHQSATQPPTAVIQSDVDEDDITITDANKTYQMHREFFGRRVSSPSMRDDEHCDAQMARGSLTSASFWVSIFHPPGLQKLNKRKEKHCISSPKTMSTLSDDLADKDSH